MHISSKRQCLMWYSAHATTSHLVWFENTIMDQRRAYIFRAVLSAMLTCCKIERVWLHEKSIVFFVHSCYDCTFIFIIHRCSRRTSTSSSLPSLLPVSLSSPLHSEQTLPRMLPKWVRLPVVRGFDGQVSLMMIILFDYGKGRKRKKTNSWMKRVIFSLELYNCSHRWM